MRLSKKDSADGLFLWFRAKQAVKYLGPISAVNTKPRIVTCYVPRTLDIKSVSRKKNYEVPTPWRHSHRAPVF